MPTVVLSQIRVYPTGITGTGNLTSYKYHTWTKSALVKTSQHALRGKRPHIYMPPTPFSATDEWITKHHVIFGSSAYPRGTTAYAPITLSYPTSDANALSNECLIACLNDLKDMKVNYAQAFAEREQTGRLVMNSAKRIARAIESLRKDLKRGKLPWSEVIPKPQRQGRFNSACTFLGVSTRKIKDRTKTAGDMWLELQYGWKPLLSDVYGSMVNLHEKDLAEPLRYRVTVKKRKTKKYHVRYGDGSAGIHEEGYYEGSLGCFIRLDYTKVNPPLQAGASLGLTNPAQLTWELVPYSFVADWFLPVGDYLGALDGALGFNFLGGSKTLRWETHQFGGKMVREGWSETGVKYPPQYWWGSGGTRDYKQVNRTVYSSSPVPRFPGFKNPLTLTHMANALALLRGSVR